MSQLDIAPKQNDLVFTVAANIRAEVARLGMSQSSLARAIGISKMNVSNRWNGRTPWTISELADVARVLGIEPRDLLTEAPNMKNARLLASVPDSYTARDLNPEPSDSDPLQLAPIVNISDYVQRLAG